MWAIDRNDKPGLVRVDSSAGVQLLDLSATLHYQDGEESPLNDSLGSGADSLASLDGSLWFVATGEGEYKAPALYRVSFG